METIKEFIADTGFPIFAFILMFYFAYNTIRSNTAALVKLTIMIERLCQKDYEKPT